MITVYGIKNCDTIKKARRFLEQQQIPYQFHDYRVDGISAELLETFAEQLDWQQLLNTRGTTWRQLDETAKAAIDKPRALALMLTHPALIKRPLLVKDNAYLLGFSEQSYRTFLKI